MDPIAAGRRNWVAHDCGPVEQVTAATALTRAQQIATGRMAPVLAGYDLTFAQLEVLIAVADRDHLVGMGELGAMLGLHPTTTARTVARLERARYVERVDDAGDRRVPRARASTRGVAPRPPRPPPPCIPSDRAGTVGMRPTPAGSLAWPSWSVAQ